jgi:hypothetical protein
VCNRKRFLFPFFGRELVFLEKLELAVSLWRGFSLTADKIDAFAKLPVGHFDNRDKSLDWYNLFDAVYVYGSRFIAGAMTDVDRELHHREPVFQQVFPKPRCRFSLDFCFDWQIKEAVEPHECVLT